MSVDTKALRRYQAGVERALTLFDSTIEWADYIAFLSRLLKALSDPPSGTDIPAKNEVARHLFQCLRPSLPAGVHQKTLEVYNLIFTIIGTHGLGEDLALYLPGLSHTLSFASLATRPQFLALYDDHVLRLSITALRPALRSIILSLLPGLEEETSEDFDRTLKTFDGIRSKFRDHDQEEIFWQNLFLASITSPGKRLGVLVYLVKFLPRLPRLSSTKEGEKSQNSSAPVHSVVTRPEPGLLVRCFATGLQDDQPLVQRGFLDLLVTNLPLDATIFSNAAHVKDLDVLVAAAAGVVLRRDMGLNRRLWTWFTGPEPSILSPDQRNGDAQSLQSPVSEQGSNVSVSGFFIKHGLDSLVRAIRAMLSADPVGPNQRAKPFRVALSLMDRSEVGGPVAKEVFVPLIRSLYAYQSSAPSQEAFDEVFRSANIFFDGVESRLIASQIFRSLQAKDLDLVSFLVSNFSFEEDELMDLHMPVIALYLAGMFREASSSDPMVDDTDQRRSPLLPIANLLNIILSLVSDRPSGPKNGEQSSVSLHLWKEKIGHFYQANAELTAENLPGPSKTAVRDALLANICGGVLDCCGTSDIEDAVVVKMLACLDKCVSKSAQLSPLQQQSFLSSALISLQKHQSSLQRSFHMIAYLTKLLMTLHERDKRAEILTEPTLFNAVGSLIAAAWQLLLPSSPEFHVETVENILRLHSLTQQKRIVESSILSLMVQHSTSRAACSQDIRRFATVWTHAKVGSKQAVIANPSSLSVKRVEIPEILKSSLIFLIDSHDLSSTMNPFENWVQGLGSADALFAIVLDEASETLQSPSYLSLTFRRLNRLIGLVRHSDTLFKSFVEPSGHCNVVLDLCSSTISKVPFVDTTGIEALQVVQSILLKGSISLNTEFVQLLLTQLEATYGMGNFQDALLDTLKSVLSFASSTTHADLILPSLFSGLASPLIDEQIDKWVTLLCTVISKLSTTTLMVNLLKTISCLCERVDFYLDSLHLSYGTTAEPQPTRAKDINMRPTNPERSITNCLGALEFILATAHRQLSNTPSRVQSVILSPQEASGPRSVANDQLRVILCMQDALRSCTKVWLWRSSGRSASVIDVKSLQYLSAKLRSRSRRLLENLIEAEPQEGLEALMGLWASKRSTNGSHNQILELLQTLDGARPKFMMPATFNAIYNRTNPAALDASQRSSLSVDVNAFDLIAFLNDYTSALEDDLLEEIWTDCTTFLRDILANPMPHRQILIRLLHFVAVLCRKMENTNFGEEARMRRELADLCARLFTAIFTIKPAGLDGSGSKPSDMEAVFARKKSFSKAGLGSDNALQTLHETLPDLSMVLKQGDRLSSVYSGLATNVTGPVLHSKLFPQNISPELLALLQAMSISPSGTKAWKKDTMDAFNDAKLFSSAIELVHLGWLPLIHQLALVDKNVLADQLVRLTPPAAAGLVFGVGATAARIEADTRTRLILRRICLLLLASDVDAFVLQLQPLLMKLEELLTATVESSPSSAIRNEVYMVFRAIVLTFSQSQLDAFWPTLDRELRDFCASLLVVPPPEASSNPINPAAKMQGAKILDLLLLLKPDEFQLHEWLFVADTVDAIYPPEAFTSAALGDQIGALSLNGQVDTTAAAAKLATTAMTATMATASSSAQSQGALQTLKKPWLCLDESRDPDQVEPLVATFFRQLSIRVFEDNYSLQKVDLEACTKDLIQDLFTE